MCNHDTLANLVVKHGGTIIISDYLPFHVGFRFGEIYCPDCDESLVHPFTIIRIVDRAEAEAQFVSDGFQLHDDHLYFAEVTTD